MVENVFTKDVGDFMFKRMERSGTKAMHDPRYCELSRESDKIYAEIKSALPEELQQKLIELNDLHTGMLAIECEFDYRQGFSDAVKLIVQMLSL